MADQQDTRQSIINEDGKQNPQNSNTFQSTKQKTQTNETPRTQQKSQSKIKNRIIITNLGLGLMKDADEEKVVDQESKKRQQLQESIKKKKLHDESTMYIGQLLQDNNQKTTPSINEKVALATKPLLRPQNKVKSMEHLFEKKLTQEQKTPYIQKQITKYSKRIMSPVNSILNSNMNASQVSNANLTKFNNNHTNFLGHMNDYTLESKNLFSQDDTNTLDKYNKVLYAESKIEHIHRRYREFSQEHDKLQSKIHQEYNRRVYESVEHHTKKLSLLEEISKENEDLIDILHRNTMYGKRKQQRNIDYMKNKYMTDWKKFQLPKLTQKSLKIHEQHEKFRNRPIY